MSVADCTRCGHRETRHCRVSGPWPTGGTTDRPLACLNCPCEAFAAANVAFLCVGCERGSPIIQWRLVQIGPTGGYISCPHCGREDGVGRDVLEAVAAANGQKLPTFTRDSLLAEITRSLRETHPDRADQIVAEIERRMPPGEPSSKDTPTWVTASPLGNGWSNLQASITTPGGGQFSMSANVRDDHFGGVFTEGGSIVPGTVNEELPDEAERDE